MNETIIPAAPGFYSMGSTVCSNGDVFVDCAPIIAWRIGEDGKLPVTLLDEEFNDRRNTEYGFILSTAILAPDGKVYSPGDCDDCGTREQWESRECSRDVSHEVKTMAEWQAKRVAKVAA